MSLNNWRNNHLVQVLAGLFVIFAGVLLEEFFRDEISQWFQHLTWTDAASLSGLLAAVAILTAFCTWVWEKTSANRGYGDAVADVKKSLDGTLGNLGSKVTEFGDLRELYEREDKRIQRWMANVNVVVNTLEKALLQDLWLSHPWEYVQFIKSADDGSAAERNRHIESITLYGTMVGFAFLLPEALRNHVCRSQGEFRTLRLIASDSRVKLGPGEPERELLHYPLYLVANMVLDLLANCRRFQEFIVGEGIGFDIEILYMPHDLISAAILLGDREVATLQALDSKTFEDILRGIEPQPGFRYRNDAARMDAFNRHETALDDLAKNTTLIKRRERWRFSANNGSLTLRIVAPHWLHSEGRVQLLPREGYDGTNTPEISFEGKESIVSGVESLRREIVTSPGSGSDVRHIEELLGSAKTAWPVRPTKCPCSLIQAQPIS